MENEKDNDPKEIEDGREIAEEDERKLPTWMLKSEPLPDETIKQNEEVSDSPAPAHLSPAKDDNEDVEMTPSTSINNDLGSNKRAACQYGENCYRTNPVHKAEYSHPGDDDYTQEDEDSTIPDDEKPECQYGTSCYRQNPQHKRDFKHTQPPATEPDVDTPKKINTRKPAKRRRTSDADYESEGDKEYDLEDSFIDDTDDEENVEEEDDEDYVPDKSELDPDLLKEDQWKPTADDAPEVLELLKEARDYLRNKNLQK